MLGGPGWIDFSGVPFSLRNLALLNSDKLFVLQSLSGMACSKTPTLKSYLDHIFELFHHIFEPSLDPALPDVAVPDKDACAPGSRSCQVVRT